MNNIRLARARKNIKQADLACALNVSQGTLSNWERGIHDPDSESLKKLSIILGVTIDFLLGGTSDALNGAQVEAIDSVAFEADGVAYSIDTIPVNFPNSATPGLGLYAENGKVLISDDDLIRALYGDPNMPDEALTELKWFAQALKERYKQSAKRSGC